MSKEIEKILNQLDKKKIPSHVAIIMDGNGRWAKKRHLPRLWGHQAGSKTVRIIVETAGRIGVKVLTLYAFSTENWARPKSEITGLMRLLKATLAREEKHLRKNNVQLFSIGELSALPETVQKQFNKTQAALKNNTGLKLVLALNYGGRQDIVRAANQIIQAGHQKITEKKIIDHLYTRDFPDPDLLIRTSGEQRISNFLLWQIAYSEFHITPVLWPEFREQHFLNALLDYQMRHRRFGGVH